ncbi:hypothetical protein AAV99_06270 [Aurantiacibacter marinus]|uniref:Uncharacterized protein n=2 Tax=Aurantiacibacter marinus TaxID=874156 RepID=A0A0H0XR15_9SPHN|nr:hypothetical protein AAV99_06270 [Aurantiacibacter marinus]
MTNQPPPTIPACLITCLSQARKPTDAELKQMAQKIWEDLFGARDGRSWSEASRQSPEKSYVYQMAAAALMGSILFEPGSSVSQVN